MRKIIDGRLFDTETAHMVCEPTSPVGMHDRGDFHYYEESLYRKRTGEYFLHGWGGPLSPYAEPYGRGSQSGERIVPLSPEQAREWAEGHMEVEEYEAEWGLPGEGDSRVMTVTVSEAAYRAIKDRAAGDGTTMGAAVDEAIRIYTGDRAR
ncbi:hypothetical protein EII22_09060 [Coriobacteriales bacterium OH1046]|nr:hypothetical protein EII22_09060 [Coriobacteriales bacterium OH1046]